MLYLKRKNKHDFEYEKSIPFGYVLTKTAQHIGLLETNNKLPLTQIMRIPAAIFCYWLGESEIAGKSILIDENSLESAKIKC